MKNSYQITTLHSFYIMDLVTPLSAYLRLREHFTESILLESADRQGGRQEFSYICCEPIAEIQVLRDGRVKTSVIDDCKEYNIDDLELKNKDRLISCLENFILQFKLDINYKLPFANGLFGFISYDATEFMEDIKFRKPVVANEDLPLAFYRIYRHVLVFDHLNNELHFLQNEINSSKPVSEAKKIFAIIQSAAFQLKPFKAIGDCSSNLTDNQHLELIESCRKHIQRGDVFQIVPSRKYFQRFEGDDINVYRALRLINPSPHLFYYKTKDFCLFGSSPEAQIEANSGKVSINPIAGTYRRTGNDQQDRQAAIDLSEDPKEVSEHIMLVDLARNDLSIHCDNVHVERFKEIEFYSHVIHLVSKVSGNLLEGKSALGAFCATAPAGTLTGAPKFKAMELLDIYEPERRHFYGGAIGVHAFNSDIVHAIMIRTFLSRNNVLSTQAGSGVVAESDADKEVQEVKNKLAALWAAVERAELL